MKGQLLLVIGLALAGAIALRDLFPKREAVPTPPRIVTVHDTVRALDTAWITRVRHDTVQINVVERVTVTVPETVRVAPALTGLTALVVGARVGDSTIAGGFSVASTGTGYVLDRWQTQLYTLGPIKSVAVDAGGGVAAQFYDAPKPPCGPLCVAKHYLVGAAIGYGSCQVSHAIH